MMLPIDDEHGLLHDNGRNPTIKSRILFKGGLMSVVCAGRQDGG
jgi:hypothetical protein